jgi:hypothetical protein
MRRLVIIGAMLPRSDDFDNILDLPRRKCGPGAITA